jgi:hypothetical protein
MEVPVVCERCGECSLNCVVVIAARQGASKHAFTATYDGQGACETTAGERVQLIQFRDRWPAAASYDLELRFTPAAAEVYCAPAEGGGGKNCAPKGLTPGRSLRSVRETLTYCRDVDAASPPVASQPGGTAVHPAAAAKKAAATKEDSSEEAEGVERAAKTAAKAAAKPPGAATRATLKRGAAPPAEPAAAGKAAKKGKAK